MRALITSCLITAMTACAGCASVKLADGIEPTRVRSIEQGESRARVEEVLGEPVRITRTATGTLVSYRCDLGLPRENLATGARDSAEEPNDALRNEQFLAARNTVFSLLFLGTPEIYAQQQIDQQRGLALVTYDDMDRVQDARVHCRQSLPESEPLVEIY